MTLDPPPRENTTIPVENERGISRRFRRFVKNPKSRLLRGVFVLLGLGVLAAALAPWTVSRGALREEIAVQLRSSTGLYVYTKGASTFSLLPRPSIRLENISFVDPRGALLIEATSLSGAVRILPLLAGRLELQEANLEKPVLTADLNAKPMSTAGAVVRAIEAEPATPQAAKADKERLGVLSFANGSARLRLKNGQIEKLDNIDATLDWRTVAAPLSFAGTADWRGERTGVSMWIARPSDLLHGDPSSLTLQIRNATQSLSLNGAVNFGQRPQFDGRLIASSPSVHQAMSLYSASLPLPLSMDRLSLDSEANITATSVNLRSVRLKIDDSEFEGALSLRYDEARPQLAGTLAASNLNLSRLSRDMTPLIGPDQHFQRESFDWPQAHSFDLDIRISAQQTSLGRMQASDLAGSILLNDGKLEFSLADLKLYKGSAKARLILTPESDGRLNLKSNIQMRGVDWGALAWDHFGESQIAGSFDFLTTLEGAGTSVDQIARALSGKGEIAIADGEIIGLDIERALRRLEKRPLATLVDIRSGRTQFSSARFPILIADGLLDIQDGLLTADKFTLALSGSASIADRQLSFHAAVTPQAPPSTLGTASVVGKGLDFDISGDWDNPVVEMDARSFINRSNAAKPLLPKPKVLEPKPIEPTPQQ